MYPCFVYPDTLSINHFNHEIVPACLFPAREICSGLPGLGRPGCFPSTVSKWCTDTSRPDIGTLVRISELLEVEWGVLRFYLAPAFVIDYVIIHELCHPLIMKHTVKFRTLLQSHCPEYKQMVHQVHSIGFGEFYFLSR